jgi:hypothetical protein
LGHSIRWAASSSGEVCIAKFFRPSLSGDGALGCV